MQAETILELLPYHCIAHDEQVDLDTIRQLMHKYDKGLFVLPTATSTVGELKSFLDVGANLILEHSDQRSYALSNTDRNALIKHGKEKVFLKGYSDGHSQIFLGAGASLLIDGYDTQLSVAAIAQLCRQQKTGLIKLVPHGFSHADRLELLRRDVGMVCLRKQGQLTYPVDELESLATVGKENLVISASDFAPAEALSLLGKGVMLVLAGDTSWNRETFEGDIFNPASVADRTRIRILPRFGPLAKRQELKAIAQDLGLPLIQPVGLFS